VTYAEIDIVQRIERLTQSDLATLGQEQRDQFDQFHVGGPEAVDRLLPALRLSPSMKVLDLGSGFGGPARQVARATGCSVVGVDITPAYVETARALTRAAGLEDQVTFTCCDIEDLGVAGFDAAYTMHVQMNVADKHSFFTEIARRLRPGSSLAVFEVCLDSEAQPDWPQPWSLDGTDSYLVTAQELQHTIEASGFTTLEWQDETSWARTWFERLGERLPAGGRAATLPGLLDDGLTRTLNFASAVAHDVVSINRGSFVLTR
jgi:cyclopropane fatty-acyl-phospholipid synthase-like methyltransferase